jgi:hypothetical protein
MCSFSVRGNAVQRVTDTVADYARLELQDSGIVSTTPEEKEQVQVPDNKEGAFEEQKQIILCFFKAQVCPIVQCPHSYGSND